MYLPQGVLRPYIDEGLIAEQRHPLDANVRMYNYTHRVQYDKSLWDDVTMNCRGLALDIQRECVVSACLKKFWNVEEHTKDGKAFPTEIPVVQEKIDGWYGHLYWLDDEPWIGTRGSFTSPGAEWATAHWNETLSHHCEGCRRRNTIRGGVVKRSSKPRPNKEQADASL